MRVFTEEGLDAHFERIAREAGVGTGTLYRNFPTREVLIEAAYRNEVARLCDAAPELLATMPPSEASAWMGRFVDYATA
ncbi:helix-turn-helix domain-containing protein [Actinopolymorpha sp. NPDC004070]|uniref:TetR/AcrR family transcriptional regulator n=1 Tax=Actinopolymorpha sp. NPDC004070 TaxID=3154548 RepID=UPI0033B99F0B